MSEKKDTIETATAKICRQDEITFVRIKRNAEQGRDDVINNLEHVKSLNPDDKSLMIIDISESRGIDREGSRYAASEHVGQHTIAMGILVNSRFSQVMANLWFRTTHSNFPSKAFTSEQEAIDWLHGMQ